AFNHADALTYPGAISGPGALIKTGGGTLVLSGSNSYAGGTTLNSGVLNINADAALGATSGTLAFSNNATLQGGAASVSLAAARGVVIPGGVAATMDTQANLMTIGGPVSGNGSLNKAGAGTLVLGGDNSLFAGAVSLNAGVLRLASSAAL